MSLYKRGRVFYCDVLVAGQRVRQSLHTTDWREARSRLNSKIIEYSQNGAPARTGRKRLPELLDELVAEIKVHSALETWKSAKKRSKPLIAFFGSIPLEKITPSDIVAYQSWRLEHDISPRTVNMSVALLRRLLIDANLWHAFKRIRFLKENTEVGRALTRDEEIALLKAARSNPRWFYAACATELALNTTLRVGEIIGLRWKDIDLERSMLTVHRAKTEAGERSIPLNQVARNALLRLRVEHCRQIARHEDCGLCPYARGAAFPETPFCGSEHYVFPHCQNQIVDPNRPMKHFRSAWHSICKKAGLPGLRFHDLRHTAITSLAESGEVSESTLKAIAGHVSKKMLERYSHIRMNAKRKAMEALDHDTPKPRESGANEIKITVQ